MPHPGDSLPKRRHRATHAGPREHAGVACAASLALLGILLAGYGPAAVGPLAPQAAVGVLLVLGAVAFPMRAGAASLPARAATGWFGLAVALALPVCLLLFALPQPPGFEIRPVWFAATLLAVWILATARAAHSPAGSADANAPPAASGAGDGPDGAAILPAFVRTHWQLCSAAATAYLSGIGILHEAVVYARLGLNPALHITPADFAFAIVNHPVLIIAVLATTVAAWILFRWLRTLFAARRRSRENWRMLRDFADHGWQQAGLRVLELPSVALSGSLIVWNALALAAVVAIPPLWAVVDANGVYDDIAKEPVGRLTLARPARYADGVRHVASTPTNMIVVVVDCRQTPNGEPGRYGFFLDLLANDAETANGWAAIAVPWTAVASFDTTVGAAPEDDKHCFGDWQPIPVAQPPPVEAEYSADGKAWADDAADDSRYLAFRFPVSGRHPPAGALFFGEPAEDGEWVAVRYSADRRRWHGDGEDTDARYAQFRIGGTGAWQPPGGFLVRGAPGEAVVVERLFVDYAVSFAGGPYRLTRHPLPQVAERSQLPVLHHGECRTTVVGCASREPFFRVDASGDVLLNRPGRTGTTSGSARGTDPTFYLDVAAALFGCRQPDDCRPFVDAVNRELNCGLANLRGLAVAAEIAAGPAWRDRLTALVRNDMNVPAFDASPAVAATDPGQLRRHANLLGALCRAGRYAQTGGLRIAVDDPGDAPGLPLVFLPAHPDTPQGHACWEEHTPHNRAAVIRLGHGDEGRPRCLSWNMREPQRSGGL